jgi:RNA polymerase sigma-70 factor (ECF subfamily)
MLEDRKLVGRLKRGDTDALRAIYDKYESGLLTLAANLVPDPATAEDIVQDVFIALVRLAPRLRLRRSLRSYLATAVANRARDEFRRQSRRRVSSLEEAGQVVAGSDGPVQMVIDSEQMHRVRDALAKLPYEQREVLMLRVHADMKFRQIAAHQGVSTKTALSRYQYGLNKLRSMLNGEVSQ